MVKDNVVTVIKMFLQAESSDEDDEEDEAPTRFFSFIPLIVLFISSITKM